MAGRKGQGTPTPEAKEAAADIRGAITGPAAVRQAVSGISGIPVESLGLDDGIYWLASLQANAKANGFEVVAEDANVAVRNPHVGVFSRRGEITAATMEGNTILQALGEDEPKIYQLQQRLRVNPVETEATEESAGE